MLIGGNRGCAGAGKAIYNRIANVGVFFNQIFNQGEGLLGWMETTFIVTNRVPIDAVIIFRVKGGLAALYTDDCGFPCVG